MELKEIFALIAIVLAIVDSIPYLINIFRKKTEPHFFTWLIFSLVTLIAFFGQIVAGGGPGSWVTGVVAVVTIFITILSIRNIKKHFERLDVFFLVVALIGLVPWVVTEDPTISVIIATMINICAYVPTIRKTLKYPGTESVSLYALSAVRQVFAIAALASFSLATYLFPVGALIMNVLTTFIILYPRKKA